MTVSLSASERKRLTAILGMLGSNAAGERDNAARMAEAFRRQHRLTWEELLALPPPPAEPVAEPVKPEPPAPEPAKATAQPRQEPKAKPRAPPPIRRITPPSSWFERFLIYADANPAGAFLGPIWMLGVVTVVGYALVFGGR